MSESSPTTPPKKQTLALDPQAAKLMKKRDGTFPENGAMNKIKGKFNLKEADKNDKGKIKLDEDAHELFKAMVEEQLTKPKKERISEKRLRALAQAITAREMVVSDDPAVQKLVDDYKGKSMGTQQMLDDSGVEGEDRSQFERNQMVNGSREARRMYTKDNYTNPLKQGLKQVATLGGYGAWQSYKERRAQERTRNQHSMLQQMGRQPEEQRLHSQMQGMQQQLDQMREQISTPPQPQRDMTPPPPMSKGQKEKGKNQPRQYGWMAQPVGVNSGEIFRDKDDTQGAKGKPLDPKDKSGKGMDRNGGKKGKQQFDPHGFDDQQSTAMGQDQQVQLYMMQMLQQLQQQIAELQRQLSEARESRGKEGVGKRVESPQPTEVQTAPQTRERGKTVTEAPKKGYTGKKWPTVDTSKPKTKEELEQIADMEDQADPSRKGNRIFDRDGRVGAYNKAEKENPNLPENQKKKLQKQSSRGMSLTD